MKKTNSLLINGLAFPVKKAKEKYGTVERYTRFRRFISGIKFRTDQNSRRKNNVKCPFSRPGMEAADNKAESDKKQERSL